MSRFFEYVTETPCPICFAPRVGADSDDEYTVFAGILHPAEKATCAFTGWVQRGDKWETAYKDKDGWTVYDSTSIEPEMCPLCGGEINTAQIIKTVYGSYGRSHKETVQVWRCLNSVDKEARVERPKMSCPACLQVTRMTSMRGEGE